MTTYTVSQFIHDGVLSDTEYKFSDGTTFKVWERNSRRSRLMVDKQEYEGNDFRRSSFAALNVALRAATEQVGDTEMIVFDSPAYLAAQQAEIEAIDMDELGEFVDELKAEEARGARMMDQFEAKAEQLIKDEALHYIDESRVGIHALGGRIASWKVLEAVIRKLGRKMDGEIHYTGADRGDWYYADTTDV